MNNRTVLWTLSVLLFAFFTITSAFAEKVCPSCGKKYPDSGVFCMQDGTKLIARVMPKARSEKSEVGGVDIFSGGGSGYKPSGLSIQPSAPSKPSFGLPSSKPRSAPSLPSRSIPSRPMPRSRSVQKGRVGIVLAPGNGMFKVTALCPGSPADRHNIGIGDSIIKIDGTQARHMSKLDAISKLQGPVGSSVSLAVVRSGSSRIDNIIVQRAVCGPPDPNYRRGGSAATVPSYGAPRAYSQQPAAAPYPQTAYGQQPSYPPSTYTQPYPQTGAYPNTYPPANNYSSTQYPRQPVPRQNPYAASQGLNSGANFRAVPLRNHFVPVRVIFEMPSQALIGNPRLNFIPDGKQLTAPKNVETTLMPKGRTNNAKAFFATVNLDPGSYTVEAKFAKLHPFQVNLQKRGTVTWKRVIVGGEPIAIRLINGEMKISPTAR